VDSYLKLLKYLYIYIYCEGFAGGRGKRSITCVLIFIRGGHKYETLYGAARRKRYIIMLQHPCTGIWPEEIQIYECWESPPVTRPRRDPRSPPAEPDRKRLRDGGCWWFPLYLTISIYFYVYTLNIIYK